MSIIKSFVDSLVKKNMEKVVDTMYTEENITRFANETRVAMIKSILDKNPYWLQEGMKSTDKGLIALDRLATSITLELKSSIDTKDEDNKAKEVINPGYKHLISNTRLYIEKFLAYGYGAFKIFNDEGRIGVEFLTGSNLVPVRFDADGNLLEVIFVSRIRKKNKQYSKLEHHSFSEGKYYKIKTTVHEGTGFTIDGKKSHEITNITDVVPEWANSLNNADIPPNNCVMPYYVYIKTPNSSLNNSEELGLGSLLLKAKTALEDYDYNYNLYMEEFDNGQIRYLIPKYMATNSPVPGESKSMKAAGIGRKTADPQTEAEFNRKVYVKLPVTQGSEVKPETFAPDIRTEKYETVLDTLLRDIENAMGLAQGELSKPSSVVKTAKEIEATYEPSYATAQMYERIIEDAYTKIVEIMELRALTLSLVNETLGEYSLTFYFGDSIAGDMDTEKLLKEVQAGLMSPIYYHIMQGKTYEQAFEIIHGLREGSYTSDLEAKTKDPLNKKPSSQEGDKETAEGDTIDE